MVCGLEPNAEDFYSWYEINLIMERATYQEEMRWNHTRHIMAALTGEKPGKIIKLSFDTAEQAKAPDKDEQARILEKYKHHLTHPDEQ